MKTTGKLFEPKIVGVNEKRFKEALRAWSDFIDSLNEAAGDICSFLNVDNISYELLSDILSTSTKEIMISLHRLKGGHPESMNLEKMVNLGLLSNFHSELIETDKSEYEKNKNRALDLFNGYNISLLFNDEIGIYEINEDFKKSLKASFTRFTKSEEENKALSAVLLIVKGLNYFIPSKIGVSYGTTGINPVIKMIKVSDDRKKFEINPNLFMR